MGRWRGHQPWGAHTLWWEISRSGKWLRFWAFPAKLEGQTLGSSGMSVEERGRLLAFPVDLGFAMDQHRFEVHRYWIRPQVLAPARKALGWKPGVCQAEMVQYQ